MATSYSADVISSHFVPSCVYSGSELLTLARKWLAAALQSLPGCPFCWMMFLHVLQNCSPTCPEAGRWRVPVTGRFVLEGVGMCGVGHHKAKGLVVRDL